jgi:adenylate kinase
MSLARGRALLLITILFTKEEYLVNIALIGPSGVGKGTYATKLVASFDLQHVVTGELFRENLENRTAVGLLAKRYIKRGQLVPDEIVDALVEELLWLMPPEQNILFDGFPRTVYQAKFLDELFVELGRELDAVIYIHVTDEEILRRLSGRLICRTCQTPYHVQFNPPTQPNVCDVCGDALYRRPDDIPELIRVRLRTFHRVSGPLLDYYQRQGKFVVIDGAGDIEQVTQAVIDTVKAVERQDFQASTQTALEIIPAFKEATAPVPPVSAGFNLVLLGGPGSGKGTQAERLSKTFALRHISSGDLFRENLKNETELGKLAKTYMDRGELVPNDVTEAMVEERLARSDTATGFILDGFPRTLAQAEALNEILGGMQRKIDAVVYLNVADAEIIRRLSGRLICRECQAPFHKDFKPFRQCPYNKCEGEHLYQRDDDNPETVRARLITFHTQTAPLVNYYQEAGLLIEVKGGGDVSTIQERILAALEPLREAE